MLQQKPSQSAQQKESKQHRLASAEAASINKTSQAFRATHSI